MHLNSQRMLAIETQAQVAPPLFRKMHKKNQPPHLTQKLIMVVTDACSNFINPVYIRVFLKI